MHIFENCKCVYEIFNKYFFFYKIGTKWNYIYKLLHVYLHTLYEQQREKICQRVPLSEDIKGYKTQSLLPPPLSLLFRGESEDKQVFYWANYTRYSRNRSKGSLVLETVDFVHCSLCFVGDFIISVFCLIFKFRDIQPNSPYHAQSSFTSKSLQTVGKM